MMLSDYYCEKSHKHKQQTVILKISHLPYARQQVNFTCMLLVLPFTDLSNATIEIRLPGVFICYCQESHKQTQQNFTCMFHCIHAFVVIETNNASLCCQKRTTLLESLLKHISILTIQSISVQSKSSQHFKKQERVSQAYEMSVSKKRVRTKRTTL